MAKAWNSARKKADVNKFFYSGESYMTEPSQASTTEARTEIVRQVVVVTGFGGEDPKRGRRAILDVMRVKYLVEHMIEVKPQGRSPNRRLHYKVDVFRAPTGAIPDDALSAIDNADVLIALITEQNVNVIFEIAVRNLLHDEFLILLGGESENVLPIYLQSLAHIDYKPLNTEQEEKIIQDQIENTAVAPRPTLLWTSLDTIPDDLVEVIKAHDARLLSELQHALQNLEDGPPRRPAFLRNLVKDLDPGRLLSSWITYNPYSMLRIRWRHRLRQDEYTEEDMVEEPIVYSGNQEYLRIFNRMDDFSDPDGNEPLTFARLMQNIKNFVEEHDLKEFLEDQTVATKEIIYRDGFARVKVPLRFNHEHPFHPNKSFLPQLVAKRIVGDVRAPHSMFILVSFVEISEHKEGITAHGEHVE